MQELEGLLVVSLEQAVAAPFASSRLADAGARVIKIERAEGDFARRYDSFVQGESAYFVWLNRGKESLVLDIKQPQDLALLKSMLSKADVFIQNLAPQAVERLGLDVSVLQQLNPRLITCWISGYGDEGAYKNQKAYDLLVQAESGLADITGEGESRARVGVSVADISCGLYAYSAILQALLGREKTGKGSHIDLSLYSTLADYMNVPYLQYAYGGATAGRHGLKHPTIAPYGAFECKDNKLLLFSIQNEREWVNLCELALEDKSLATHLDYVTNIERVKNRAALDAHIAKIFTSFTREEMITKLEKAGIAYGRVSSLQDMANHPQNRYINVETPSGTVRYLAPAARLNGKFPSFKPVPKIGEQSEAIRQEFEA